MPNSQNLVLINTNFGPVTIELHPDRAPTTVTNFLQYVDTNFYDGTIFHRVIDQFMIQGGGLTQSFLPKTTYAPISLESNTGLENDRGTVAMARTNAANSATSQFFINTVDNPFLNYQNTSSPGYAVFGTVVDGMDVVDRIADTQTITARINGTTYQNFPYPTLVSIFSADRYTLANTLLPTTHTTTVNEYGVTMATYTGSRFGYGIKAKDTGLTVTRIDGLHSGETLPSIDRVAFTDKKMAFDLAPAENAGKAALFIGAIANNFLTAPSAVGTILSLLDQGKSLIDVSQMAIDLGLTESLAGSRSNADLVKLVFRNITGAEASSEMVNALATNIQGSGGSLSQAEFLATVATLDLNQQHIGLIGLQSTGLEYA